MTEFLRSICFNLSFTQKWDDLLWLHYKHVELEELDSEDFAPPDIEISHFLMLFIFDFAFTFISNFTSLDKDCNFVTKFAEFNGFFNYAGSIIASSTHNFFNAYKVSDLKKKIIEADCEKSEYNIKDTFNHYGVAIILYLIFKNELKLVDLKTKKEISAFPLPISINPNLILDIQESMLYIILKFENRAEVNLIKQYRLICLDLLQMVINIRYGEANEPDAEPISFSNNPLLGEIFNEILLSDRFKDEHREFINKSLARVEASSLVNLLGLCNDILSLKKLIKIFSELNLSWKGMKDDSLRGFLEKLCFRSFITEKDIFESMDKIIKGGDFNDLIISLMKDLEDQEKFILKVTHDSKENAEKEIEAFKKNHQEIISFVKKLSK